MTTVNPFAGDRLDHPAIARTVDRGGAIRIAITGQLDREVALVLAKLIRIDLLDARAAKRSAAFVLDLAHAGYLDGRALELLKDTTKLVQDQSSALVFAHVNDDLREHLERTRFLNVFTILEDGEFTWIDDAGRDTGERVGS
jgi:anti-anti-sigma factor